MRGVSFLIFLIPLSAPLFLIRAPESCDQTLFSTFLLKRVKNTRWKKVHIKHEGQNIFIHCLLKKPTSKAGINGRRAFVVVILLVVKRKVLGSLWNGSDVISVRKDIWSAVDHIWADFPGADASQCGDLFGFGSERLCTVLLAQLMRSRGSTGLQELYFEIGSCCVWLMWHIYIRLRKMLFWKNITWEKGSATLTKVTVI